MKNAFIFFTCLLSFALVQADPISGCCGKKKHKNRHLVGKNLHLAGCGCGGNGGENPNQLPPDENS